MSLSSGSKGKPSEQQGTRRLKRKMASFHNRICVGRQTDCNESEINVGIDLCEGKWEMTYQEILQCQGKSH
jgi:hypothetical protein